MVKLAIDIMGGDFAPDEIIRGVNLAMETYDDLELTLFGDESKIQSLITPNPRIHVVHAPEKINMGEKDPISLIRRNKELSLVQTFRALREGLVDGVVTAGPTQGVIVASHLIVRRLLGMKRVALCPTLPTFAGKSRLLLDVGANIDIRPEHMLQHAMFASVYMTETQHIEKPLVGLVNIGAEPGKGRELEHEAFELLSHSPHINFYGNVEPKEVLTTECDILLTDGFSGNLVMKTIEGTAKALGMALKEEIGRNIWGKIGYLFMKKNLQAFKKRMSADDVGGAVIFGVDGIIVKAHGSSNAYAFSRAIHQARLAVLGNVVAKMKEKLVVEDE
ncbi:MAG: phosphate acyltransferase PlsX [Bacilli bacterium]|nr:phosphate acyltransferase PlsX [Bacilli bacterium]